MSIKYFALVSFLLCSLVALGQAGQSDPTSTANLPPCYPNCGGTTWTFSEQLQWISPQNQSDTGGSFGGSSGGGTTFWVPQGQTSNFGLSTFGIRCKDCWEGGVAYHGTPEQIQSLQNREVMQRTLPLVLMTEGGFGKRDLILGLDKDLQWFQFMVGKGGGMTVIQRIRADVRNGIIGAGYKLSGFPIMKHYIDLATEEKLPIHFNLDWMDRDPKGRLTALDPANDIPFARNFTNQELRHVQGNPNVIYYSWGQALEKQELERLGLK